MEREDMLRFAEAQLLLAALCLINGTYMFISGRLYNIDPIENNKRMYKQYGPIVKESVGNMFTVVHLFNPDDIETVYRNDGKIPQRHAFFMLQTYNTRRANNVQGLLTRFVIS